MISCHLNIMIISTQKSCPAHISCFHRRQIGPFIIVLFPHTLHCLRRFRTHGKRSWSWTLKGCLPCTIPRRTPPPLPTISFTRSIIFFCISYQWQSGKRSEAVYRNHLLIWYCLCDSGLCK